MMNKPIKIKSSAEPIPKKIGTMQTADAETGEVVAEKKNAMTILGPPPDKCQVCAVAHDHDQSHNQQSLYYQMRFYAEHSRWPTWTDAMSHCTPEVRAVWRRGITEQMQKHGLTIPDDLLEDRPCRR